jgi:photosystem II stability/assembly factor-like uncharacterized protein
MPGTARRRDRMFVALIVILVLLTPKPVGATVAATTHQAVYAGFADGRIFTSIDGGLSWQNLGGPRVASGTTLTSLAVDSGSGATLYAGTNAGVFRSTDAGQTWTVALPLGYSFVASAPRTPGLAYAFANPSNDSLVLASTRDGGAHWSRATLQDSQDQPVGVVVDPGHPATVCFETGNGMLLSDDGGHTWRNIADINNVVWDQLNPSLAFAVLNGSDVLMRTTDRGAHWRPSNIPSEGKILGTLFDTPASLLTSISSQLFRVDEGTGKARQVLNDDISVVASDPVTPALLVASGTSTLYRSVDSGVHWTALHTSFSPYVHGSGFLTGVALLATGPRPVLTTDPLPQDPARSTPPATAPLPSIIYGGWASGDQPWIYQESSTTPAVACGGVGDAGSVSALVIDPLNSSNLFAATTNGLYISNDACKTWHASHGPGAESVSAVALDRASGTIYAAVLPNQLWIGDMADTHWQSHTLVLVAAAK